MSSEKISWEFKKLIIKDGKAKLVELEEKQKAGIPRYAYVLERALDSQVSNPIFSNYHVREAIGFIDNITLPAGNIEYGFCKAQHGEESAIAAFRSLHDRSPGNSGKDIQLGIIAEVDGDLAGPCGNCRDIWLGEFGSRGEIISGAPTGGLAIVANFSDYLFDGEESFQKIPRYQYLTLTKDGFMSKVWDTKKLGEKLENDGFSPKDLISPRKYYASITTKRGAYYGALDLMSEYHPIYPIEDAIRQARRAADPYIESVVIIRKDAGFGMPYVMYRDRQHLFELNLQQELMLRKEINPKVYLVSQKDRGQVGGVWETSVKQWLPFPFSARNFGDEFVKELTKYYNSKVS